MMKGMPVSAVAPIYETLYCIAMTLLVVTNSVFRLPTVAVERRRVKKAVSLFHVGQFCSGQLRSYLKVQAMTDYNNCIDVKSASDT
jgi:hypothetical protein